MAVAFSDFWSVPLLLTFLGAEGGVKRAVVFVVVVLIQFEFLEVLKVLVKLKLKQRSYKGGFEG